VRGLVVRARPARVLIAAALAVGGTVASSSAASAAVTEVIPGVGFGGYRYWPADVSSVSATWQVPSISPKSPDGSASTWIGAQNDRGGYPFIQVGTIENDVLGFHEYFAFWSDTAVDFHPQLMGHIGAGDRAQVSMTRRGGVWLLALDNLTSGHVSTADVTYGSVAPFTQAEWFQEDPTPSNITAKDVSYPMLTDTRFTDVRVNGVAPKLKPANGQTLMATGGVFRVPTPFVGDAFRLVAPTGYGRQYLADAYPVDMAIDAYQVQLAGWRGLDRGQREASTRALIKAYNVFQHALQRQAWPATSRPAFADLISEIKTEIADLTSWAATSALDKASAFFVAFDHTAHGLASTHLRAALGLAPA
jgi:Peptidase A4 family